MLAEDLSHLSDDEITTRVREVLVRAQDRLGWSGMLEEPEGRQLVLESLDAAEAAELAALRSADERRRERGEDAKLMDEVNQRARQIGEAIDEAAGHRRDRINDHSPLLVSEAHMRAHAQAIRDGSTFGAVERIEERAKVTVGTHFGSAGAWDSNAGPGPVTLRSFAGVPNTTLNGATAQMPSVTLPAGAAGVTEAADHGEFDAAAVANLSALRYGRWSDVTSFVDEFDDLQAINYAHAVGVARDLNLADITAIQTAAGSVTAFDANNLDRNVRQAILKVAAAALVQPSEIVLFGGSSAMGVVTGYAPTSGDDRGSVTVRVFGARAYVDEQAVAGNVYAFAPKAFRTFSSRLRSASVISPESGNHRFGQWLHSTPPGVGIVGAAAGVDVVTP